jgi:small membrane protein
MIIQVVLVAGFLAIIYWLITNRKNSKGKAWQKLGLILLLLLAIVSVLFPDTLNDVAHFLGVGRGADLILYAFVFTFIAYVAIQYVKQKENDKTTATLVRRLAIIEANERIAVKKLNKLSKG